MTLGIMPVTGLPLPFVSYGGSSMFAVWLAVRLLQSITVQRPMSALSTGPAGPRAIGRYGDLLRRVRCWMVPLVSTQGSLRCLPKPPSL